MEAVILLATVAGAAAGAYAGPIGAAMGAKYAKDLAGQNKLMEELAPDRKASEHTFPGRKASKHTPRTSSGGKLQNREAHTGDKFWVGKAERIEGMELRALRKLLDEVDAKQEWGGLKKESRRKYIISNKECRISKGIISGQPYGKSGQPHGIAPTLNVISGQHRSKIGVFWL